MSLFAQLRSLFPPSSRSFHAMYEELGHMHKQISEIQEELEATHRTIEHGNYVCESVVDPRIKDLQESIDAHIFTMEHFAWETYRREEESLTEAKKRFFITMPQAQEPLRTFQQCTKELLRAFDAICTEHAIPYWIAYGTLLGAVRHQGFVPWDDDVDLGILRKDLVVLQEALENDTRFRITVIYDYFACCKQIRFRWVDDANPCFLDIFPYDTIATHKHNPDKLINNYRALRQHIMLRKETDLAFWRTEPYMKPTDRRASQIADAFMKAQTDITPYCTSSDKQESCQLLWGIENVDDPKATLLPISWVFPTQRIKFEDIECWAPAQPIAVLTQAYGDIYTVPHDIKTHYRHIDLDAPIPHLHNSAPQEISTMRNDTKDENTSC